jgi:hypothetical protein
MQLFHRVRHKTRVQTFKRVMVVCAVAHTHTGATGIHGHLQIVGGVANHQGAISFDAKLAHQLVEHQRAGFAGGFVCST